MPQSAGAIEHNTILGAGQGIFVKTEASTDPGQMINVHVRYIDCPVFCYQNTIMTEAQNYGGAPYSRISDLARFNCNLYFNGDFRLVSNGQNVTGNEELGIRANPTY